jgi:hypothetical protein
MWYNKRIKKHDHYTIAALRLWYTRRASALIMIEMSFFSPLTGQPKNMTDDTIAALRIWYHAFAYYDYS